MSDLTPDDENAMETAVQESNPAVLSMRDLLEAGVHFGHQTKRWNPKMKPYIYGARNGIHIVNLAETVRAFYKVYHFVAGVVARGDSILFVGTKKQAQEIVAEEATRGRQFFVTHRWLGGMLTNWRTIRQSVERLKAIEKMKEDDTYLHLTKKEILRRERERLKLERNLGGIKDMVSQPGALFVVDPKREHIAVCEARRLGIPVVAIVDTNCDPDEVDYTIPGNDDAIRAIRLFCSRVADACLDGAAGRRERARMGDFIMGREQVAGSSGSKVEVVRRKKAPRNENRRPAPALAPKP